jgi:hypothetical protein
MTGRLASILLALLLLALVALTVARAALTPATIRYWEAIAACETHSNWGMRGPVYEGGLGFYVGTWRWWARELQLLARYPHAYMAPRIVQIRVADYGARVHRGYWGCA